MLGSGAAGRHGGMEAGRHGILSFELKVLSFEFVLNFGFRILNLSSLLGFLR